MAAMACRRA